MPRLQSAGPLYEGIVMPEVETTPDGRIIIDKRQPPLIRKWVYDRDGNLVPAAPPDMPTATGFRSGDLADIAAWVDRVKPGAEYQPLTISDLHFWLDAQDAGLIPVAEREPMAPDERKAILDRVFAEKVEECET